MYVHTQYPYCSFQLWKRMLSLLCYIIIDLVEWKAGGRYIALCLIMLIIDRYQMESVTVARLFDASGTQSPQRFCVKRANSGHIDWCKWMVYRKILKLETWLGINIRYVNVLDDRRRLWMSQWHVQRQMGCTVTSSHGRAKERVRPLMRASTPVQLKNNDDDFIWLESPKTDWTVTHRLKQVLHLVATGIKVYSDGHDCGNIVEAYRWFTTRIDL